MRLLQKISENNRDNRFQRIIAIIRADFFPSNQSAVLTGFQIRHSKLKASLYNSGALELLQSRADVNNK